MRDLGLEVSEDDAGSRIGSNAGNLYARVEATDGGTPLFLCAHLDTVPPEAGIDPVLEDGVIRNAAGTILGADNKSAVAVMLEATRRILSENRPHGGLELLFTPMEETGLHGAAAFDQERLHARIGYVYDQAAPIGEVILGAPYSHSMEVKIHGRAAHSGMYPEEGRSAIAAAAKAIADFKLGRVDEESTANVGLISGGTAGQHRPRVVHVPRRRRARTIRRSSPTSSARCSRRSRSRRASRTARSRPRCTRATTATGSSGTTMRFGSRARRLERAGFEPSFTLSGGAADANVFNERGLACVNLANGMAEIHTPDEHIAVADLERMVDVTLALVDVARETDAA